MLACFCSDKRRAEEEHKEQMAKVESAFKKFDLDGDGFLSWEEFQQVNVNKDISINKVSMILDFG